MTQEPGRALDYAGANRHSQQLFLANMLFKRRVTPRLAPEPSIRPGPRARKASTASVRTGTEPWKSRYKNRLPYPRRDTASTTRRRSQLALFDMAPDPEAVRRRVLIEDSELTRFCAAIVDEHAERYGSSSTATQRRDPLAAAAADPARDPDREDPRQRRACSCRATTATSSPPSTSSPTAELLIEDRPDRVEVYFAAKTAGLPPLMHERLELWLQVMVEGPDRTRRVPRDPQAVRLHPWASPPSWRCGRVRVPVLRPGHHQRHRARPGTASPGTTARRRARR